MRNVVVRSEESNDRDDSKPYLLAGAGRIASSVWKCGNEESGWEYRFDIFKMLKQGRVTQRFRPADLPKIAKLVHLLARILTDDGCLSPSDRQVLTELRDALDHVV